MGEILHLEEPITAAQRSAKYREFVTELDNRIDEFNASLPPGYGVVVDMASGNDLKYSIVGKHVSVTGFYIAPAITQ